MKMNKYSQEGKIELRESKRQDNLDSVNSDDEYFVVNNFNFFSTDV